MKLDSLRALNYAYTMDYYRPMVHHLYFFWVIVYCLLFFGYSLFIPVVPTNDQLSPNKKKDLLNKRKRIDKKKLDNHPVLR